MGTFEDDLVAVFTHLAGTGDAVDVTHSGTTVKGILDLNPRLEIDDGGLEVELRERTYLVPKGALSPTVEDAITCDGTAYRVRAIRPEPRDERLERISVA